MVSRQFPALDVADPVNEKVERPRGRHARIELPQASRGRVARIHERLLAACQRLLVEALETRDGHEHLAPDLEQARHVGTSKLERQRSDGAQILRDVLARLTVAASGALHEGPALHSER